MRVSQLDSRLLDDELLGLLTLNIDAAFGLFSRVDDRWTRYSRAAVRAIVWKLGIWDRGETYGSAMQSLRYVGLTRWKKVVLGLVTVVGPLLQERLGGQVQGRVKVLASYLEAAFETFTLLNFIAYIAGDRYDSLLHRILRIRLKPTTAAYRAVSFEFLNRQLVWSQFTEFLLVFLPLLNLPRLRRKLANYIPLAGIGSVGGGDGQLLGFLPEKTCSVCFAESRDPATVVNPYVATQCRHIFCYTCVVSQLKLGEGEGWPCNRCGVQILGATPYREIAQVKADEKELEEFKADEDEQWHAEDNDQEEKKREADEDSNDDTDEDDDEREDDDENDDSEQEEEYSEEGEEEEEDFDDDDDERDAEEQRSLYSDSESTEE
ncbi:peroxisome assembly protein (Peroxin-2) [Savitreella phatthalungensis]